MPYLCEHCRVVVYALFPYLEVSFPEFKYILILLVRIHIHLLKCLDGIFERCIVWVLQLLEVSKRFPGKFEGQVLYLFLRLHLMYVHRGSQLEEPFFEVLVFVSMKWARLPYRCYIRDSRYLCLGFPFPEVVSRGARIKGNEGCVLACIGIAILRVGA